MKLSRPCPLTALRVSLLATIVFSVVASVQASTPVAHKFSFLPGTVETGFLQPLQNQAGGVGYALSGEWDAMPGSVSAVIRYNDNLVETGSAEIFLDATSFNGGIAALPNVPGRFFAGYISNNGYADFGLFNFSDLSTVFSRRLSLTTSADNGSLAALSNNTIGVLQDGGASITLTLFDTTTNNLVFERTYTSPAFLASGGMLTGQTANLSGLPDGSGYVLAVTNYELDLLGGGLTYDNNVVIAYLSLTGTVLATSRLEMTSSGPLSAFPIVLADNSVFINAVETTIDPVTFESSSKNHLFNIQSNGTLRWSTTLLGGYLGTVPSIAPNGDLYLSGSRNTGSGGSFTSDGVLVRLSAASGSVLSQANFDLADNDSVSISGFSANAVFASAVSPGVGLQTSRVTLLKLPLDLSAVSTAVEYDRDVNFGILTHISANSELLLSTLENSQEIGAITLTENFATSLPCTLFTPVVVAVTNPGVTVEPPTFTPAAIVVNSASSVPVTGTPSFSLSHSMTTVGDICAVVAAAPVISSALTANVTVGTAFSYTITATNSPTSFNATGLPNGLAINTTNGAITGSPTTAGVTNVTISATNATGTGQATLEITIAAVTPAPVITSTLTATGTVGTAFNYTITATNSPTSFNATGLPGGLSVNTGTGAITGTPTTAGVTNVTISATNAGGTGPATLVMTINPAPPVITSGLTAGGTVGSAFNYAITATNTPTSYNATGLPAGLVIDTNTGAITGTPTTIAITNVTISGTNAGGTGQATLQITIVSATAPSPPAPPTGLPTAHDTFTAQWTAVVGATGYRLDIATDATFTTFVAGHQDLDVGNVTSRVVPGLRLGTYYVRVRAYSAGGTSASSTTILVEVGSRLLNLSTRGQTSVASPMIAGFFVSGAPKTLLIRATSEALVRAGIPAANVVPNPRLRLLTVPAEVEIASNDDWDATDPDVIAATTASGAGLQLMPGSVDSVIVAKDLPAGGYTAVVDTVTGEPGVVLIELYEVDGEGRLINISTRGLTFTAGADVMIPGTYIGPTSKRLMIRVAGERLVPLLPAGSVLVDPILEIYDQDNPATPLLTNDDWDPNDAALVAAWTPGHPNQVAGLNFVSGSSDAAVIVLLPKNNNGYTAIAKGKNGASGTVLMEIYELP